MKTISSRFQLAGSLLLATLLATGSAWAGSHCAAGKTRLNDQLLVATGNPAYPPWVMNDDPESGEGFEAAVAYAVAEEMGFTRNQVRWLRTSFDEAIQPGEKAFDFNIQQYSIRPERAEVIDFSEPYYTTSVAVVVREGAAAATTAPTASALRGLKFGAAAGTTSREFLDQQLKPSQPVLLYDDNADVIAAISANQIDALVFDLPSALFVTAVQLEGGKILGQFPRDVNDAPDSFGLLMAKGSPLKPCVDAALAALKADGRLAAIESQWLAEGAGVPVIDMNQ